MRNSLSRRSSIIAASFAVLLTAGAPPGSATPDHGRVIADIDLSKPFASKTAWRFVATQGRQVADLPYPGETAPGVVRLCLKVSEGSCRTTLKGLGSHPWTVDDFAEPHFLKAAAIVYPPGRSAAPLLLLQTASVHSGDGDQFVFTQLLAYRAATDKFAPIYEHETGRNNNQEVRFIPAGPLAGDVIAAQPTDNSPYGFWITVSQLTPDYRYKQVLRYRSATRYGDGNPLAVIDSEMPNIERRLGLWKPGAPLPLPTRGCANPRLVRMELWCG